MKKGDLYKQVAKNHLHLKAYVLDEVEKFQKGEIFTEWDFLFNCNFEYGDFITPSGETIKLKYRQPNTRTESKITLIPVWIHLRTMKLFIFRINFKVTDYFEKVPL
jgi:hypothetical protein